MDKKLANFKAQTKRLGRPDFNTKATPFQIPLKVIRKRAVCGKHTDKVHSTEKARPFICAKAKTLK